MIWLGGLSFAIWLGLCATGFWRCTEREDGVNLPEPRVWPDVVAVIPARNEADVIAQSLGSVVAQDYPGNFRVILVDDNSEDATGEIARNLKSPSSSGEGLSHIPFQDRATMSPSRLREGLGVGQSDEIGDLASMPDSPTPDPSRKREGGREVELEYSAAPLKGRGLEVLSGTPLPPGWTGKLWALSQGITAAKTPHYLWLTDADIEHAPDTLRRLVTIAEGQSRVLVSFMAKLHCRTWPERAIIPAFVYYFSMLYPFNWINRPSAISGAAGGCVLVQREALERAGGIAAIRAALIDDCALGALMKKQGPIWLGLTHRSRSIRPYLSFGEVGAMIARSAYAQLRYSPLILAATVFGLLTMFAVPVWLTLAGHGAARLTGVAALLLMILMYQPMLRFYRLTPLWALAQPLIGIFYTLCVLASGWQHIIGRGGMWKGRAQANAVTAP